MFWIHIQNKYRNKNETEISKLGSTWEWLVCLPHFEKSGQVVDKFKRNAAMCTARMTISNAYFLWWRKESSQKYRVIKNGGISYFLCVNEIFYKSSPKKSSVEGFGLRESHCHSPPLPIHRVLEWVYLIPPLSHVPSWHAWKQLYFCLFWIYVWK